jgi:hypothetical protein
MSIQSSPTPNLGNVTRNLVYVRGNITNIKFYCFHVAAYEIIDGESILLEQHFEYQDGTIVEIDVTIISDNTTTVNHQYFIDGDQITVEARWNADLNIWEYFNLDGSVYLGDVNLLTLILNGSDRTEYGETFPYCADGVLVFRSVLYGDPDDIPMIIWRDAQMRPISEPANAVYGACSVQGVAPEATCCDRENVWLYNPVGQCYEPLTRVRIIKQSTGDRLYEWYYDSFGAKIPAPAVPVLTELPPIRYEERQYKIGDGETFDFEQVAITLNQVGVEVSGRSYSFIIPRRRRVPGAPPAQYVDVFSGESTIRHTRDLQVEVNGHLENDIVGDDLKITVSGAGVDCFVFLRLRVKPIICAVSSIVTTTITT